MPVKIKFEKIILYWASLAALFFAASGLFAFQKSLAIIFFLPVALFLFVESTEDIKAKLLGRGDEDSVKISKKGAVIFFVIYLILVALSVNNITNGGPPEGIIIQK